MLIFRPKEIQIKPAQSEFWTSIESAPSGQWVLKRIEFPGVARVNQVTSASLGYLLSVFNKNSSLKTD